MGVGVLLLVPAVLIYIPYHRARADAGLERTLQGWYTTPASFLATPSRIDSAIAANFPQWLLDMPRAYLFPGYVVLIFLIVAPWFIPRDRRAGSPPDRWLRRLALGLEIVATVYAVAALLFAWYGVHQFKIDDTVLLTLRRPGRTWLIVAIAVAARWATARWVPLAPLDRARRAFAGFTAWRRRARTSATVFYGFLTAFAITLLLGPPFGLWQFVYWIPPLSFIRAPLRFSTLVVLGLAMLLGIVFDRLTKRWSSPVRATAACVMAALLVVEFAAIPLAGEQMPNEVPALDRWLNSQPKPFTVAEVPLASPDDVSRFNAQSARYMMHSTAHFQKTVEGFTGVLPPDHSLMYQQLSEFPTEDGLKHLLAFHTTYVVVHGEDYAPEAFVDVERRIHQFSDWLTLVHAEGRECIYALHAPNAGAAGSR
jgi:hypothetical protein